MGLTNPGRALGWFLLRSTSRKFSTLAGIPPFSTNWFQLASLLSLLVVLNLSFLIVRLCGFQNHKSRCFRVRRGVPQGSVLGHVLPLFITGLPVPLPSSFSCSHYTDNLAITFSSPSVPTAVEATQGALFRLEGCSEYWCLPLNLRPLPFQRIPTKLTSSPNSSLHFNSIPAFLAITFDRTFLFSKYVSSLKVKLLPRLKVLRCISASS